MQPENHLISGRRSITQYLSMQDTSKTMEPDIDENYEFKKPAVGQAHGWWNH